MKSPLMAFQILFSALAGNLGGAPAPVRRALSWRPEDVPLRITSKPPLWRTWRGNRSRAQRRYRRLA